MVYVRPGALQGREPATHKHPGNESPGGRSGCVEPENTDNDGSDLDRSDPTSSNIDGRKQSTAKKNPKKSRFSEHEISVLNALIDEVEQQQCLYNITLDTKFRGPKNTNPAWEAVCRNLDGIFDYYLFTLYRLCNCFLVKSLLKFDYSYCFKFFVSNK